MLEKFPVHGSAMATVAADKIHLSILNFEEKSLIRAEQHEYRRSRHNLTSCRSPTREIDTKLIKNELKEKRQQEFLRRRSMSPEMCGSKLSERQSMSRSSTRMFKMRCYTSETATNGKPSTILSQSPSSSKWTPLRSDPIKGSTSTSESKDLHSLKAKGTVNVRTTKTIRSERVQHRLSQQSEFFSVKRLREVGVQTESGFVTVRETDLQKLSDYLQEALWHEEILQKKLAFLQGSSTSLMNASDKIWTSRCSEDLLKNKIRTLEAQLQVCLQKFPKDAVKKLFLQMERQKLIYEDKAVIALQKATQEKSEAVIKADTLQGALTTAQAEGQRWQQLYKDLKVTSEQLRLTQDKSHENHQQQLNQLELSRVREGELMEELVSLKRHNDDLQYNIHVLEEDNEVLSEEIQQLRDGSSEVEELLVQQVWTTEETEQCPKTKRSTEVEEQLQQTLEKLQLKEKECEELRTELSAMELECQSTQNRLSQCREQLRQTSHRPRTTVGWCWWLCLYLMVLLALVVATAMLSMWYPPFSDQLWDVYSDFRSHIQDYIDEMSSPQHSGCFRPV